MIDYDLRDILRDREFGEERNGPNSGFGFLKLALAESPS